MIPRQLSFLLLSLFACSAISAAPPVVKVLASGGAVAYVPAGHRVAWSVVDGGGGFGLAGIGADPDRDGQIYISARFETYWTVVDLETGEWTSGTPASDLPPRTIVRGTNGTYSKIYAADPGPSYYPGGALWVRPGIGAWSSFGAPVQPIVHAGGRIIDALQMRVLSNTTPPVPPGFVQGDRLFLLHAFGVQGGVVDSQFDDSPSPGTLLFAHSSFGATDEGTTIRKNIVRLGGTDGTVSVRWSVSGTAEAGIDYVPVSPMEVVFGPGETDKQVVLPVLDDGVYNASERTVIFTLSDAAGGASVGIRPTGTASLNDDDPAPLLAFGDVPASVIEGDEPWMLDVPFVVTGAFRGTLAVKLRADYTVTGPFYATPALPQQIAKAPIPADDNFVGLPRAVNVGLFSEAPRIAAISRTVALIDDDQPPVVIEDATVEEATIVVSIMMRTDWDPYGPATVSWSTADGTARAGEDYVAKSGTTDLSSGLEGFGITLIPDEAAEATETFYVDITSVSSSLLPPSRTRIAITIIDDDLPPPPVTVEATTVTEGDYNKSIPVRVHLASAPISTVRILFASTTDGTATPGKDFGAPLSLTFKPGETTKETKMGIAGDIVGEPDETAVFSVLDKWLQPIGTGTVTIFDNDRETWPIVTISAPATVEGNSGVTLVPVKVRLATALPIKVKMALWTADGTATAADYDYLGTPVEFLAGETEREFQIAVIGDTAQEGNETIALTTTYSGMDIASASLTILDDDGDVSFATIADTHVVEKTGVSATAVFGVLVTPAPKSAITMKYATEEDTAGAADFRTSTGTLSLTPGQTEAQISVAVFGDAISEYEERFSVRLFEPNGVTIYGDRAWATITDDDAGVVEPLLTIEDVEVHETNGWTDAAFTLRLSKASSKTVKVSYATADESARSASDYEHSAGTVSFAPGTTTRTVAVRIVGDAVHEETETFTVWLSNGDGAFITDARGMCTVLDDDELPRRRSARH